MEIQGKIIVALPARGGVSQRGEWQAQDFVLETHDTYPKKLVFTVFGADRLARFNIQTGQEVLVSFDVDAHEYNGRWYNDVRAFDVRPVQQPATAAYVQPTPAAQPYQAPPAPAPQAPSQPATPIAAQTPTQEQSLDDLPF